MRFVIGIASRNAARSWSRNEPVPTKPCRTQDELSLAGFCGQGQYVFPDQTGVVGGARQSINLEQPALVTELRDVRRRRIVMVEPCTNTFPSDARHHERNQAVFGGTQTHGIACWRRLDPHPDKRVFAGETVQSEYTLCVEGEDRAFEQVVAPVRVGGEVVAILGVAFDVTELQRAQDSLQKAKENAEAANWADPWDD